MRGDLIDNARSGDDAALEAELAQGMDPQLMPVFQSLPSATFVGMARLFRMTPR